MDLQRLISSCSDRSAKSVDSTLEDYLSEPVPTARTRFRLQPARTADNAQTKAG